jgi:hypothetical protein
MTENEYVEHTACMRQKRSAYKITVTIPRGKRLFEGLVINWKIILK